MPESLATWTIRHDCQPMMNSTRAYADNAKFQFTGMENPHPSTCTYSGKIGSSTYGYTWRRHSHVVRPPPRICPCPSPSAEPRTHSLYPTTHSHRLPSRASPPYTLRPPQGHAKLAPMRDASCHHTVRPERGARDFKGRPDSSLSATATSGARSNVTAPRNRNAKAIGLMASCAGPSISWEEGRKR